MESAIVGSPMRSCHALTGTWLVISVEARSVRSSRTSSRSCRSGLVSGGEAPVVDHEQVGLGQAGEGAEVGAIAAGDVQLVEEARGAHAVGGIARAAGALGEGLPEPGLADAGGADEEQVAVLSDPGTGGERLHEGLVQAAARTEPVDVLQRGLAAEVGLAQAAVQLALFAVGPLGIDEQADAILETEVGELGGAELALEGLGQGGQAQGTQFVDGGVSEHTRLLSGVVGTAADVGVDGERRRGAGPAGSGTLVEATGQDVLHGAVAGGAEPGGARGGRLQAGGAVGLAQAHEPEAGAVALLGVGLGREDGRDELGRGRARRRRPGDQAGGRPFGVGAMGVRHVRGVGGVLAPAVAAAMGGDAPALEEQLDDRRREPDLDALVHELVGDAVVVVLDGDVVVDVDPGVAPLGELVARRGAAGAAAGGRAARRARGARRRACASRRALRPGSRAQMAAFSSAMLKKRRLRSAARIQRCATSTLASTTALSRGWPARAGTTAAP